MGGINLGRVVVGGLLAGLVIDASEYLLNDVVLGERIATAMQRLNLPPIGGGAIGVFIVLGFAFGIATIWLYAAIRPRFDAGVRTALFAGAAVWFFAYLYPSIGMGGWDSFRRACSRWRSCGGWPNFSWPLLWARGSTKKNDAQSRHKGK